MSEALCNVKVTTTKKTKTQIILSEGLVESIIRQHIIKEYDVPEGVSLELDWDANTLYGFSLDVVAKFETTEDLSDE